MLKDYIFVGMPTSKKKNSIFLFPFFSSNYFVAITPCKRGKM